MSRVIRFRAWMKEERQMVMVAQIDFTFDLVTGYRVWKSTGPDEETRMYEESSKCELMQFTGLHDKNGKEIWEGDVVRYPSGEVASVYWSEVREGVMPCYALEPVYRESFDDSFAPALDHDTYHRLEVIGNIYENPEFIQSLKK